MDTRRMVCVSELIGRKVRNPEGEHLGDIENMVMDRASGCVAYGVLSFGGFLGLGDKLFAVPWNALVIDDEHEMFVLDVDKDMLKLAPGFAKDNWPDMADVRWSETVHRFYGTTPASTSEQQGGRISRPRM